MFGSLIRAPQQRMHRRPGRADSFVILIDRSGSMPDLADYLLEKALKNAQSEHPTIRAFGFLAGVKEIDISAITPVASCLPPAGNVPIMSYANSTFVGQSLRAVAGLQPEKTIIISDGGAIDKGDALSVAASMTGSIDCYYCVPHPALFSEIETYRIRTRDNDPSFLQRLARAGGGTFSKYSPINGEGVSERLVQTLRMIKQPRVHHLLP